MRKTKRAKVLGLAWLLLSLVVSGAAAERPNLVFILADDLGYGDLGSYGQKIIKTPDLDKLARVSMKFTDFYAKRSTLAGDVGYLF